MTKQYKIVGEKIIKLTEEEKRKIKIYFDKNRRLNKFMTKICLKIAFCIITAILFLWIGLFMHEFFHLMMVIYFGAEEVEFYVGAENGYIRYTWTDELTIEEKLIVTMAGSLFSLIVLLLVMIYLYSKDKMLAIIPLPRILHEIMFWYKPTGKSDMANYIEYNPTITFAYVNNMFLGLIILGAILMMLLIMLIVFNIINEISKIEP